MRPKRSEQRLASMTCSETLPHVVKHRRRTFHRLRSTGKARAVVAAAGVAVDAGDARY